MINAIWTLPFIIRCFNFLIICSGRLQFAFSVYFPGPENCGAVSGICCRASLCSHRGEQSFGDSAMPPSAANPRLSPRFITTALGTGVLKSDAPTRPGYPQGEINVFSSNRRAGLWVGDEDVSFDLWSLFGQVPPSRAKFRN